MVLFNYTTRELTAKIVYYGPGLCGKTTNLQFIYDNLPGHVKKGKMLSLATKTDRTLFFDFLPIELGRIRGLQTRVQLYTVPGQVFYNSTRKLVLKGADGIVFVADSQQKMAESNIESYRNLEENLAEIGLRLEEMPLVMQFNKRDLPNLTSVEEMNTLVNRHNAPFYEAVATTGIGVEDTLKAITKRVLNHLASRYNLGTGEEVSPAAARSASVAATDLASESSASVDSAEPSLDAFSLEEEAGPAPAPEEDRPESIGARTAPSLLEPGPTADAARPPEDVFADGLELDEAGSLTLEDDLQLPEPEPLRVEAAIDSPGEEDLSDLLEEIPDAEPDRVTGLLENPEEFDLEAPARSASPIDAHEVRITRSTPILPSPAEAESSFSPLDPLGIDDLPAEEGGASTAIDLGSVIPGHPHQVTLPLEMSVQGRTVRLQLRMTLTLTD